MLKKGVLLAVLALALPLAALADSSVDFTNNLGTLTASGGGLVLNSTLTSVDVNGGGLITGGNLGSMSFSTGALASGSLQTGGTFAPGGSFIITGNGSNGAPSGVIFSGTFSKPVDWTVWTLTLGKTTLYTYTLGGVLSGMLNGAGLATGATTQLTMTSTSPLFNGGSLVLAGGATNIVHVPESSSLSMMGMLLITLVGAFWRKAVAQPSNA